MSIPSPETSLSTPPLCFTRWVLLDLAEASGFRDGNGKNEEKLEDKNCKSEIDPFPETTINNSPYRFSLKWEENPNGSLQFSRKTHHRGHKCGERMGEVVFSSPFALCCFDIKNQNDRQLRRCEGSFLTRGCLGREKVRRLKARAMKWVFELRCY